MIFTVICLDNGWSFGYDSARAVRRNGELNSGDQPVPANESQHPRKGRKSKYEVRKKSEC
jgi:hypothetical protein